MKIYRTEKARSMILSTYDQAGGSPLKTMLKVFLPEALFPTEKNVIRLLRKMSGGHLCEIWRQV